MADRKRTQGGGRPAQSGQGGQGGGNRVFYIIGALIVIAGIAWMIAARGGSASAALPTPAEFEGLAAAAQPDPSVGIAMGPENAPIEILEFADYSCPYCAQFVGFAGKLLRQNYVETENAPVRWIAYEFILGGFPNSVPASMTARCAAEQGMFWTVHDMLFSRQSRWYTSPNPDGELRDIAEQAGLDMGAWRECMSEARYVQQLAASRKYGEQLGVGSTPTIFLNGQRLDLSGVEPYSYIEGLIQAELAGGDAAAASEGDG